MGHYMFRASYSQGGLQGLLQEGAASRTAVVEGLCASLGGRLVANYWGFGTDDFFAIVELPDDKSAAAAALTVGASGVGSDVRARWSRRRSSVGRRWSSGSGRWCPRG